MNDWFFSLIITESLVDSNLLGAPKAWREFDYMPDRTFGLALNLAVKIPLLFPFRRYFQILFSGSFRKIQKYFMPFSESFPLMK